MQWYFSLKLFAAAACSPDNTFFGLAPWYKYLQPTDDGHGGCKFLAIDQGGIYHGILLILLAVLDDLLIIAGLVAVGFIIYGGIQYITSQGNPEDTAKARGTIINALIGLLLSMVAVGLVSFIGNSLGGKP